MVQCRNNMKHNLPLDKCGFDALKLDDSPGYGDLFVIPLTLG